MNYKEQLKHPNWIKARILIMKRDKFKCRVCETTHHLQVHHMKYEKRLMAWEYQTKDMVTLCRRCHKIMHPDKVERCNRYKVKKISEILRNNG